MPAELLERADACPKRMRFGPCGGVALDGGCEVGGLRCAFLDEPTRAWDGAPAATAPAMPVVPPAAAPLDRLVVADLPARALDRASLDACAERLRGRVGAVLAGDSGAERVQFPPAYRARLLQDAGLAVWAGLNCRDRNRVALEGELAALADAGVLGVHCVTGDHPLTGSRPDAAAVFDLDSTRLASLARAAGLRVSVAEAPAAPPTARRAARLREKERAGASVCFVDHAGGTAPVARFIAEARALGSAMTFIPCLPVVVDRGSAELLRTFTTLVLPPGYLEGVLGAADPRAAGVAAAVALGRELLALDGVVGVNLSGGPGPESGGDIAYAEALGEIGMELAA